MLRTNDYLADIMLDSEDAYREFEEKTKEMFGKNYTERQLKAVYLFGCEASNLTQHI